MQALISFLILLSSFTNPIEEGKPVVVVELFTSEGCSSCPPADKLLSDIVSKDYDDVEVIGLSFHVDYWDYIGWKDPYASERFTQRQRTYARKFRSSQIYTPQMVVNGKHEFVGSDRGKWNQVLASEKTISSNTILAVEDLSLNNRALSFDVHSNQEKKTILNVAVVERSLAQQVTRGENRGRKLVHDNVVRYFTSRQFDGKSNKFTIDLPSDLMLKYSSLILYTQEEESWGVVSAKKLDLDTIK